MCENIGHVHTPAQCRRQVVQLCPGSLDERGAQQDFFLWALYHLVIFSRSITAFRPLSQSCPIIDTCPGGSSSSTTAPDGMRSASIMRYGSPGSKTGRTPGLGGQGLESDARPDSRS